MRRFYPTVVKMF